MQYAEERGFSIVKTYTDAAKSGLRLKNRNGLKQLLKDVVEVTGAFRAIRLENGYSAIASLFTNEGEGFFKQMLSRGSPHVTGDLGEGTFKYEGAQAKDDPQLTMWRFRIYGDIDFGGGSERKRPIVARHRGYRACRNDPESPILQPS